MNRSEPFDLASLSADDKRKAAEELCHLLQAHGYNFVVAGGGARDTALGQNPKDFDIVVYGWPGDVDEVSDMLYALDDILWKYAATKKLGYAFMPSYHDADDGGDFGSRLWGVYKVGSTDIIINKAGTWVMVLAEFDYNFNQFYFPSSIPHYSGQYNRDPNEFVAYPYEPVLDASDVEWYPAQSSHTVDYTGLLTLSLVRPDSSPARRDYIEHKFAGLREQLEAYVERKQSEAS